MDGMATPGPKTNNSTDPQKTAGTPFTPSGFGGKTANSSLTSNAEEGGEEMNHKHEPNWASKTLVVILIITSLLVVLSLAPAALSKAEPGLTLTKDDQYQAVFLNNGQVYFGKLSSLNNEYVVLKDIYYLQVNQQVQPRQGEQAQEEPEVELVKLGNELHGPEDEMFIVRDKIVFWENLKADGSQVTEAIKRFQSGETSQDNDN
jgi:hypothetical protein